MALVVTKLAVYNMRFGARLILEQFDLVLIGPQLRTIVSFPHVGGLHHRYECHAA